MSWVIKNRPERVSSAVLLDPVCFLLFLPEVRHPVRMLANSIYKHRVDVILWHANSFAQYCFPMPDDRCATTSCTRVRHYGR